MIGIKWQTDRTITRDKIKMKQSLLIYSLYWETFNTLDLLLICSNIRRKKSLIYKAEMKIYNRYLSF